MKSDGNNINTIDRYRSHFEELTRSTNGDSSQFLGNLRKDAFEKFAELNFPTTKDEEWKYTNVSQIANTDFTPRFVPSGDAVTMKDVERFSFKRLKCHRLVFVNGHYSSALSSNSPLPDGVTIKNMAAAISYNRDEIRDNLSRHASVDQNAFTALSTAFIQDGAFLSIPDGVVIDEPIHLLNIASGDGVAFIANPRNLIVVGKNAQVSIIESYVSLTDTSYFTNAVTEIVMDEGSVIEHDKFQDESLNAYHVSTTHVKQGARSNFTSNSISLGGLIVRNNITALLAAQGSECTLNGLSLGTGDQHIDNHTTIDHAHPHCNSYEVYKSVLDGKSRGVFNGKIFVRRDAQKTDAKQTNKTLLLSDHAMMDTKPQLEIFADDVKCTHGATIGQLDEEQTFYLRSRGIDLNTARDILTFAFAADVVHRVHIEPLRDQLDEIIHERLRKGRSASV